MSSECCSLRGQAPVPRLLWWEPQSQRRWCKGLAAACDGSGRWACSCPPPASLLEQLSGRFPDSPACGPPAGLPWNNHGDSAHRSASSPCACSGRHDGGAAAVLGWPHYRCSGVPPEWFTWPTWPAPPVGLTSNRWGILLNPGRVARWGSLILPIQLCLTSSILDVSRLLKFQIDVTFPDKNDFCSQNMFWEISEKFDKSIRLAP